MCKISTSSKKGSLKTTGSPGSETHDIEGLQAFGRALPTCTNEASILSENGGSNELTIDDYSSDDSGEPIMDSQPFQRSDPVLGQCSDDHSLHLCWRVKESNRRPQTSAAARGLDPTFKTLSYMRPWESHGSSIATNDSS
ncbi:hypothetical protein HRG_012141 [Hirsutella rhossiliensis]